MIKRLVGTALCLLIGVKTHAGTTPDAPAPLTLTGSAVVQGAGVAQTTAVVQAAAPVPLTPAAFVGAARSIEGELALLDGGPLSTALTEAARQGRPLRLLLDPGQLTTRLQGVALQGVSTCAQVRWKARSGKKQRRLIADESALLTWGPGQVTRVEQAPVALQEASRRFERQWRLAVVQLPEDQRLDDALHSLPDPRENDPHFIRRREASGE